MKTKKDTIELKLRAKAEAQLAMATPGMSADGSWTVAGLLHDLQVHQIELEMQNEALRAAQVALEDSRDRYMNLFEFAPVGYLTLNAMGIIEEINLTGASMLGLDRARLRHRRLVSFIPAETRDEMQRKIFRSLRHGEKQNCEVALVRDDASPLAVLMECRPTTTAVVPHSLRVVLTDITRLRQAMDEMLELKDRLDLAKNAGRLGIYDYNLLTGKHYFDERLCELWGLSPTAPVSYEQFVAGIHPDDRVATLAIFERAGTGEADGIFSVDYRVVSSNDGKVRHVIDNGQVLFKDGRPARVVGTARDISVRRQQEQSAQQRQSQLELLTRKQVAVQTAAAIAHELNQPLASISAYSEAALRMLREGAKQPDKLLHALEASAEQAQRAGKSVRELLAFLHQSEAATEGIDLGNLVRDTVAMAMQSGYGEFRYTLEIAPQLPQVFANRLQVQKVLMNLLNNSVESMRTAGAQDELVQIIVRPVEAGKLVQVVVKDRGQGLDNDAISRVFEPFFTSKKQGMGLGLAISRALIEANGGQLWADQQTGPGATFNFTLPVAV